jgi:hypothetical protein
MWLAPAAAEEFVGLRRVDVEAAFVLGKEGNRFGSLPPTPRAPVIPFYDAEIALHGSPFGDDGNAIPLFPQS